MPRLLPLSLLLLPLLAGAAEGMWPLNRLPLAAIQQQTGARLDPSWVQHAQASAANVGRSSGSLVSPDGLVLTNHHVARNCIARLSSAQQDLEQQGFVAAERAQERRCPGLSVRLLERIEELKQPLPTDPAAQRAEIARLEAACSQDGRICSVVPLYGGALHHLYVQREFADVRLAMAVETQAANFGGDDDNFAFPRFSFDIALLRVYGPDGQPLRSPDWLRPSRQPLRQGDAVFVLGQPRQTDRLLTLTQTEAQRDLVLPLEIAEFEHELKALRSYAARSAEAARQAAPTIVSLENRLKVQRGELQTLRDPASLDAKRALEARLRSGDPGPWQLAAASAAAQRRLEPQIAALRPLRGSLMTLALGLAQWRQEGLLAPAERLDESRGSAAQRLEESLRADGPVYPALETVRLQTYIERARAALGDAHPAVRLLLAGRSPAQAAAHWLSQTELGQGAVRRRWLQADDAAWQSPGDPLLALALQLQALRRPVLLAREREVQQVQAAIAGPLARLRWKALGDAEAPDANGHLRLSYGRVTEMDLGGLRQPWKTTLGGLYARADAFDQQGAYALSPRLAQLRADLPGATPLNFVSDTDTIGGNSGSPIVNAQGELVGLLFDGNLGSLGSRFHFDPLRNRTVAVHLDAIFLALEKVYDAAHLAREMRAQP